MTSVNSDVWHYAEEGPNGVVHGKSKRARNNLQSVNRAKSILKFVSSCSKNRRNEKIVNNSRGFITKGKISAIKLLSRTQFGSIDRKEKQFFVVVG